MYSRANNIEPQLANEVTKQIDKYENVMKYAEDEEKEHISIYKYVDKEQYGYLIEGCKRYMGIVDNVKAHPCATLCFDGDIEEEVGITLAYSETTKKKTLVAVIESETIDSFGFLKQDYLIVDSIGLMYDIYEEIGLEPMSVNELIETTSNDSKTWDIYANGYTMCVNQCEQEKSTQKVMRYKPQNISELTQFVAAIRPSFQSMYKTFENREKFEYGIKVFDDLIQDEYCQSSFILYQENLMCVLGFTGFEMRETYEIIKAISKKKVNVITSAKESFAVNFAQAILNTGETNDLNQANEMALKVWHIIEDSAAYGFNSAHAMCMAIDSLTLAYLKAYYPMEFYKVTLQRYTDKGDKNKVSKIKKEMINRKLKLKDISFGADNRAFGIDNENNCITQTMSSIKSIQQVAPEILYELGKNDYDDFIELYQAIKSYKINKQGLNSSTIDKLIDLNYFHEFGSIDYLHSAVDVCDEFLASKQLTRSKLSPYELECLEECYNRSTEKQFREIDNKKFINNLLSNTEFDDVTKIQLIKNQVRILGYTDIVDETVDDSYYCVEEVKFNSWGTPFVQLYHISTGESEKVKVDKKWYNEFSCEQGDVLNCVFTIKEKSRKQLIEKEVNGVLTSVEEWCKIGEYEMILTMYSKKAC